MTANFTIAILIVILTGMLGFIVLKQSIIITTRLPTDTTLHLVSGRTSDLKNMDLVNMRLDPLFRCETTLALVALPLITIAIIFDQ
jgi:hypothetical protein